MSATGGSQDRDESPSSDVSPLTMPDGSISKTQYFSPLSSPRLDSIPEQHEHHDAVKQHQYQEKGEKSEEKAEKPHRRESISSISFREPSFALGAAAGLKGQPKPRKDRIRTSSPAPPTRFQHHVSFDNFAGGEPTERNTISFTLNVKHKGYTYKKRSRTFMVGIDENAYSDYALQWMLEELVDDCDEIVCLRVVDKDAKISSDKSLEKKQYQEEAKQLMEQIQAKNDDNRAISIVLEFAVGKVHSTFQKMIELYEPCMLIVGTRGRSLGGFQGLVSNRNSFSKWCLQYSPIPVVVVRPTEKRDKKRMKRANDPTRQSYVQLLHEGGQGGTHEANASPHGSIGEIELLPALSTEKEAHEVAAALGLPARFDPTLKPININQPNHTRKASEASTGSPDSRPSSPGAVMKSPKSQDMESEDESGEDSEGEFEAVPGHVLLENESVERQMKLHEMEQGEAAALAARRNDSVVSVDSSLEAEDGDDGVVVVGEVKDQAAKQGEGVKDQG